MNTKENAPACAPTQNRSETENLPTAKLEGQRSHEDTPTCIKFQQDTTRALGRRPSPTQQPSSRKKAGRTNRPPVPGSQSTSGASWPRSGGRQMVSLSLKATIVDHLDQPTVTVNGRDAWALQKLVDAGSKGCTPIDHPGPRWSGYVFNLRRAGIHIETVHEPHQGQFPGTHARYVLLSRVKLEVLHGEPA